MRRFIWQLRDDGWQWGVMSARYKLSHVAALWIAYRRLIVSGEAVGFDVMRYY